MKRFLEVLASPLWTVLALLAAAALVYVRIKIGPFFNPSFFFGLSIVVLANTLLRLGYYLFTFRSVPRYSRGIFPSFARRVPIAAAPDELKERLSSQGYAFRRDRGGWYGEQRDTGYWGGVLVSASILIIMITGMFNYLNQFQGLIFMSPRAILDLNNERSYNQLAIGPLRSLDELDLKMHMRRIMLPPDGWPRGGADLEITDGDENMVWNGVLTPESGVVKVRGLSFSMPRLMYEGMFSFWEDGKIIWGGDLKFYYLRKPMGRFIYQGDFRSFDPEQDVKGTVLLDPLKEPKEIFYRVTIYRDGEEKATFDLGMGDNQRVKQGNYEGAHWGYARWAEIDVVTPRILFPLYIGGLLLLTGLALRLAVRPRRVWIRPGKEGSGVRASSSHTKRLMGIMDDRPEDQSGPGTMEQ